MNCPNCGKNNEDNKKFCTSCGQKLSKIQENKAVQQCNSNSNYIIERSTSLNYIKYIIGGIIVLVVIFLIFYTLSSTTNTVDNEYTKNNTTISKPISQNINNSDSYIQTKNVQQKTTSKTTSSQKKEVKVQNNTQPQKNNVIEDFMY